MGVFLRIGGNSANFFHLLFYGGEFSCFVLKKIKRNPGKCSRPKKNFPVAYLAQPGSFKNPEKKPFFLWKKNLGKKKPSAKAFFALKNRQKEILIQSRQNSIFCKPLAMPAFGKQTVFPLFQFFCIWAGAANTQNSSHAISQFFEQKILQKNNKKVMYKILVCFV